MRDHIVAVDIGTTSARAGVFDREGRLLAKAKHPILMFRPRDNHAEHDSEDIWSAACTAVKAAMAEAGLDASRIAAIGFDATCSLVVRDTAGQQLSVSTSGESRQDTIVWHDHRAIRQAEQISATEHAVLQFSGGSLSPEMEMPKLKWLKEKLPQSWAKAGFIFDLADFLTWKATGSTARSRCTVTAKWNYVAHETPGWKSDYLAVAGLNDLIERAGLPEGTAPVGTSLGRLTVEAARALGLDEGVEVAPGLIDAYAGAFGALGNAASGSRLESSVALIGGTSSCIVAFTRDQKPGRSLWGPYYEAVLPEHWLVEGGQSAAGALLDHIVRMHAAGGEPTSELHGRIIERIGALRAQADEEDAGDANEVVPADIAPGLHILPDFHGNRSPLADPHATGVISGLTLDTSFDGLCRRYWRTCVAIALGIRHILDAMAGFGYRFETLHVTGGHVNNPLLIELYADVTGRKVVIPQTSDAVLLGTAMTAAVAGGLHGSLFEAGTAMDAGGEERLPDPSRKAGYDRDYRVFLTMIKHREELKEMA
jgi:FGGY-family pentulose kinase